MDTSVMMQGVEASDILQKPAMHDEAKQTAMQFLSMMAMHTWLGRPRACPVVAARMVQLTLWGDSVRSLLLLFLHLELFLAGRLKV